MSVSNATSISSERLTTIPEDLLPIEKDEKLERPGFADKFISFAGEKPKYLAELFVNALAYLELGKVSLPISSRGFNKAVRPFFGSIDTLKGVTEMISNSVNKSYKSTMEFVAALGYLISDTADVAAVTNYLSVTKLAETTMEKIGRVKNIAAMVGLGYDIYKVKQTISKLKNLNEENLPHVSEANKPVAKQIKAEWIRAELNKTTAEAAKNLAGIGLCSLGFITSFMASSIVATAAFALIGSLSLAAKLTMHFNRLEGSFWSSRMVQVLDSQKV